MVDTKTFTEEEQKAVLIKKWEELGLLDGCTEYQDIHNIRTLLKTDEPQVALEGIKENKGKLFYELDFRFIEAMAKRMAENKGDKYPRWNWKKPIDVEELIQANNRHNIEVMDGNYSDGEKEFDHVVALACNAMMIWHQLKHHNK